MSNSKDSQQSEQKLWFGVYGRPYLGNEPAFFDDDFSWRNAIEENFDAIKSELSPLMANDQSKLQSYIDADIQSPPDNWKILILIKSGKADPNLIKNFPKLAQVLSQIGGITSACFSLLEPHSRILPHTGETNGYLRVHLGISIPGELPECGFRVKDETRAWQEGKLLVFLDAFRHEAFNNTDKKRYLLILDIIRPEFESQYKRMCITSASMLSLNRIISLLPRSFLPSKRGKNLTYPTWLISALLFPFMLYWYVMWPFIQGKTTR